MPATSKALSMETPLAKRVAMVLLNLAMALFTIRSPNLGSLSMNLWTPFLKA